MSAGKAVEGTWHPSSTFAEKVRDLQRWIEVTVGPAFRLEHVKAHVGHPLNDVDWATKQAATGNAIGGCPPASTVAAFHALDLSWIATACEASVTNSLPIQSGSAMVWAATDAAAPSALQPDDLVPTVEVATGTLDSQCCDFSLRAITLNAQGLGGKHALLEAQFSEHQANVVFIQEAKDKCGVCHTKHFLRLNTEAERHFGISIWISKRLGVFSANGKAALVHESDVRVVYETPRLLVLEVDVGGLKVALFGSSSDCTKCCGHSGGRTSSLVEWT